MALTGKINHIARSDLVTKPSGFATGNVQHPIQRDESLTATAGAMHHHQCLILNPVFHKP